MKGRAIELRLPLALAPMAARESLARVMRVLSNGLHGMDGWSLAVHLRDLHATVAGEVRVPVEIDIDERAARWECGLKIRAIGSEGFFPTFTGTMSVTPVGAHSEIWLQGTYEPPLGAIGAALDRTVLRHAAQRSLESFLTRIRTEILRDARANEDERVRESREMHR